jgi:hypothetical protein
VTDSGAPWPTPPVAPKLANVDATLQAAAALWSALDSAVGRSGYAAVNVGYRTLAYQAAAASGADADLLANWRWTLQAWNKHDRDEFNSTYARGVATH